MASNRYEGVKVGDHHLKKVLLGNATTGKTSIAKRFTQNHFGKAYLPSHGLGIFMKNIKLPGKLFF